MDVAIVAPCPIPYVRGGAENLWRGLQAAIDRRTEHQAEIIKLPSRELEFWDLLDSYRRFAELDLTGFDLVVTTKYPAWMVAHPRHVAYVQHRLRGLYDTYPLTGLPERYPDAPRPVAELRAFMEEHAEERGALPEFFERVAALREADVPQDLFAFPGPFIRELLMFLDGIGLAPAAIHRYGAISSTVRERADYFPPGVDVFVAHHPSALLPAPRRRGRYLLAVGRLEHPKRIDLVVRAMRHVREDVRLVVVGTGPQEEELRGLAAGDRRIRFRGGVDEFDLMRIYRRARAVAFVPWQEDYGLVTVEAMMCGKPVITCTDSGGPTELVSDGANGFVVEPEPDAIARAVDRLWAERGLARRLGRAALKRGVRVNWHHVIGELTA